VRPWLDGLGVRTPIKAAQAASVAYRPRRVTPPNPSSTHDHATLTGPWLAGTRTRDEADRWASEWHGGPDDDAVTDEVVWWALGLLHGVDITAGPTGPLLHDDDQLREWLVEFRRRCRSIPAR